MDPSARRACLQGGDSGVGAEAHPRDPAAHHTRSEDRRRAARQLDRGHKRRGAAPRRRGGTRGEAPSSPTTTTPQTRTSPSTARGTEQSRRDRPTRARPRSSGQERGGNEGQGPRPLPPTQERHGYDGRPAAASRVPTRAQVSSAEPGGRGTRQGVGGGRRPPLDHTQRHRRTGGGKEAAAGTERGRSGPRKARRTRTPVRGSADGDQTDGRSDRRAGARRANVGAAGIERDATKGQWRRGRPQASNEVGGGTGTIPKNRRRVGCQGTTRGLTARGLQHNGGPAATPRTPTGLPLNPWGPPPRGGPTTATDDTDEPQPAPWKQVSQGTYRRPPPTPHTHPPCPTLFPHPPAHRGTPEKHITQGHPPGHGGQGVTPTRGEAISGPRLTRGREGERHGTGKAGRSPVRGRGRAGSTGEGRQCTRGKGCEAGTRVPAQGEEKGPRHARQTSTGSHHHTHEGSPMTPGTPGGLSRPRALHDPAPPPGTHVQRLPPPCHVGGGGSSASSHPSVHLSTLISSVLHLVHPPGPDAWGKRS